jgi:hypothetical protein
MERAADRDDLQAERIIVFLDKFDALCPQRPPMLSNRKNAWDPTSSPPSAVG